MQSVHSLLATRSKANLQARFRIRRKLRVSNHLSILDPAASLLKRSREEGAPIDPRVHARWGEDGDDVSCRHDSFHLLAVVEDEAAAAS